MDAPMSLRVKNTFLTADGATDCDGDGNFTLDVAYRQYSAPAPRIAESISGASPLRHVYGTGDFSLGKAKELSAQGPQHPMPVPQSEPEGEPHIGAMAFEEFGKTGYGGNVQQQHPPKSALVGGRQVSKEAASPKRAQTQHRVRVSFHELDEDEGSPKPGTGAEGAQEEPDELDVFPWSRLVTGGSEHAFETANVTSDASQSTLSAMAPFMQNPYFPGVSQEGGMPMMPVAFVPNGMYPPGQQYMWPGQGLYPMAQQQQQQQQQQQGTPGPSEQTPDTKQQPQELQGSAEGQSSVSCTPRISSSARHARGRGSLIDLAKREQAQRQRTPTGGPSINFCPYCRGKVQAHHRFCQYCGASLNLW